MRRAMPVGAIAAILATSWLAGWPTSKAQAQAPQGAAPDAHQHSMQAAHGADQAAARPVKPAPGDEAAAAGGLRAAAWRQVVAARDELLALAEAVPAEKYGWRPGPGVRSVGEVYMHVANANYFLPTFWGVQPPAGVDRRALEKEGADKARTVATLKASFDHLRHAIDEVPDADLGKPVNFFGRQLTVADLLLQAASHAHEHLGQSIAYARMNGIVPPWSAPDQRGK
jgi:uncharacterized damage-inducible protein DinB